jgi:hypothetical protein
VDVVQVLINALVVGAVGVLLATMTHGLRREVRQDIGELRAEVRGELRDVRAELREIRSDLTRVALALGAERRVGNR